MDENYNYLIDSEAKGGSGEICPVPDVEHIEHKALSENNVDQKQEAFECNASDINGNDVEQQSLEKLSELTAAMSRLELETKDADLCRQHFDDLGTIRIREDQLERGIRRRQSRLSTDGGASASNSWFPASSGSGIDQLQLPFDCSNLTFLQQQGLMKHLQEQLQLNKNHPINFNETAHDVITSPVPSPVDNLFPSRRPRTAYVWNGELPPRNYSNPMFSCKIFVGGVPWDITEPALLDAFAPYGNCRVEWPGKEARYSRSHARHVPRGKVTGYVYMIFDMERSVKALLQDCSQEFGSAGEWYFKLKARRNQTTEIRQVQIIPWVVSDASYVEDPGCRLDPKKTVFVGALHGMITSHVLFSIMNELYGNVVFVGIDTDKYKYPIGSGRVTFRSHTSYFRAIESAFLEIKTSKFGKKVQIDPFLEDSACMMCEELPGPYFCRDRTCFRYFCVSCWHARHIVGGPYEDHRPLMRNAPRVPSAAEENETYLAEQHMAYGAHSAQHHNYVGCAMRRYGNGPSMMYHVGVRGGYPSRQSFY